MILVRLGCDNMSDASGPGVNGPNRDENPFELEERQRIHERRARAFPGAQPPEDKATKPESLIGLALSGGGLRSALFNDGFLQGLSHSGFLRYVDYLCSVSGGG